MNFIDNTGPKRSATIFLFYLAFFIPMCLFFDKSTYGLETIEFKLAWDANTEADLNGYQIYIRDEVYGYKHQMIGEVYIDELVDPENPIVTIARELSDNSINYIAVTAVDTQGNISDFSNEVCLRITGSTFTNCFVDKIIAYGGALNSGIWYYDVAASKWIQMTSNTPDGEIAAGDFTGDGIADSASIWASGLWYQDGATLEWTKVPGAAPGRLTTGDITGDGRSEIIGTWSSGIWYYDVAASKWIQMTSSTPDGEIAAGDFTGDGKADVASCWSNGLWFQNGDTLDWTKVTNTAPTKVTAGNVTGD